MPSMTAAVGCWQHISVRHNAGQPCCYAEFVSFNGPTDENSVSARALEMVSQVRVGNLDAFGRAEQIERQLEAAMGIGILNSGERLPPELILAECLGVSPLTLRQSLAMLRSKGLIETRRGRGGGSYVSGIVTVDEADIRSELLSRRTDDLRDLGDLAASVSASAVRLAASRADSQDIGRVRELAVRFERAQGPDELRRADSRFHIGLGVASQSQRLTALLVQVHTELAPVSWGDAWSGHQLLAAAQHNDLTIAVENRDAAAGERLAIEHFGHEASLLIDQHLELLTSFSESA